MTSEKDSSVSSSSVNLRHAAMNLAHRLSSLRDFIPAANELITCNDLPPEDVKRHCRKIVTLIEIARATLTQSGIKLHQHSSCIPALARHKLAYFNMLRMLQQQRHLMQEDQPFQDRVNRLLLPLATNLRAAPSEDTAQLPSGRNGLSSVAGVPSSSLRVPTVATQRRRLSKAGSAADGQMLPPDVLLRRPVKTLDPSTWKTATPSTNLAQRGRQWMEASYDEGEDGSDEEENESRPVVLHHPRRRFGIFCTGQQGPRHPGGMSR
ncbi:hypothetical protein PHLGIDRAFT_119008 [Phlebiopsis gigantea 11061_1 CR5-6]|uniref:Uncharacterized protein n=1 Tax=Phlebiopsis gigantea (strain 11061_1 CR5-6) TaxID=745531 RepID=A0A0C3S9Q2_PHLG1|nr:hypothetical protein PHLGIDRAFT_119008 [Phlebiopsis gigantea 11061_1 CR5-6]